MTIIKFSKDISNLDQVIFVNSEKQLLVDPKWLSANRKLNIQLGQYLNLPEIKTDAPVVHIFHSEQMKKIYCCCLGKNDNYNDWYTVGGILGKQLRSNKSSVAGINFPTREACTISINQVIEALLEGTLLGNYHYAEFKAAKGDEPEYKLTSLVFQSARTKSFSNSIDKAMAYAGSTNLARDTGNKPANFCTPTDFQSFCKNVAKETGLTFSKLDENKMKKLGMGCFMGVTQGSDQPGFLNILKYNCKVKNASTIMLVGKGLTFDSGGISLKPAAGMESMKHDMCGGAAVLGAMRIIGLLKPKVNVIGLIPASENLPSGKALKPGDVLTAFNGKTVEIINTDAEGRLILADALAYGVKQFKPDAVIDIATLTGACVIALGAYNSGMVHNNEALSEQLKIAAKKANDPVWEMPNDKLYEKSFEGTISDLKNSGGREAGMILAGLFLKQFIGETPWAHIDIAGTSAGVKHVSHYPELGATGSGTRLMAELVLNWKKLI